MRVPFMAEAEMLRDDSGPENPSRHRNRLPNPRDHKTDVSTVEGIEIMAQAEKNNDQRCHGGDTDATLRNSSRSSARQVSVPRGDENASHAMTAAGFSDAAYKINFLGQENHMLKIEREQMASHIRMQNETIERLRHERNHAQSEMNAKSVAYVSLWDMVEEWKRRLTANILPGARGDQAPNEVEVTTLHKQIDECKHALQKLEDERDQLQQENNNTTDRFRRKIDEYKAGMRKLEEERDLIQRKMAEQQRQMLAQTAQFAQELESIRSKDLVNAPKVSDTTIRNAWEALGFSIRQFVAKYLPDVLDLPTTQRLAQRKDFSWLPQAAKTLQVPLLCSIFLESWIWHCLFVRIFDPRSDFWAGSIGEALSTQFDQLRDCILGSRHHHVDAIVQLHDWRVRSTHFVSRLDTHDREDSSIRLVKYMLGMWELATSSQATQNYSHRDVAQHASEIVAKAARLDQIFRMSKAHFQVFITGIKPPLAKNFSFGFQFDPETMECIKNLPLPGRGQVPNVDLAISPGILKSGNSDGANYDSERVLVKLRALCNLPGTLDFLKGGEVDEEDHDKAKQTKNKRNDGSNEGASTGPEPAA